MRSRTTAAESAATATPAKRSNFGLLLILVAIVAFALREHYVLATIVDIPIRGDIRDYVAYAWNLFNHGVFSHAAPSGDVPIPDAYRAPGYPWLLTLCMGLRPRGDHWYDVALQMQVLLGTGTVLLAMLLARQWLAPGWALLAGLLLAIWPHHIAATGALMSEIAFGFALVAALYCFAKGWNGGRHAWFAAAGVAFGYAYLVNPLIALFPPCLAAMTWWLKRRKAAALLLVAFLLPVLALGLRNAQLPAVAKGGIGRATINFVQGSWPMYHAAHRHYYAKHPVAIEIMDEIGREAELMQRDPYAGLLAITQRLRQDPAGYAAWYLWQKPYLLWDWDIQLGAGSFYILEVKHSPLDTSPLLRGSAHALRAINPVLTILTLAVALGLLICGWRRAAWVPAAATGAMAIYFTLLHTVLQAEPRYANAYRGIEVVLVVTALALLVKAVRSGGKQSAASTTRIHGGSQTPP